ncbi:MAG: hypothetical protein ACKVQR_14890 [Aquabacterium sp.]
MFSASPSAFASLHAWRRPWRAALLALLLLAAQSLALAHGVLHGSGPVDGDTAALFHDHEADGAQCRLIDGLVGAGATAPVATVWTVGPAVHAAPLPASLPPRPQTQRQTHQARAPPSA